MEALQSDILDIWAGKIQGHDNIERSALKPFEITLKIFTSHCAANQDPTNKLQVEGI